MEKQKLFNKPLIRLIMLVAVVILLGNLVNIATGWFYFWVLILVIIFFWVLRVLQNKEYLELLSEQVRFQIEMYKNKHKKVEVKKDERT